VRIPARAEKWLFWAGRVAFYSRNAGSFRPDYAITITSLILSSPGVENAMTLSRKKLILFKAPFAEK
jgi:hypothetical protein